MDDGRGLQLSRIKQIAIESGQISKTQINKMSDKRISKLIFLPGLTTTEDTDITAGRGIGMDIIKTKVEKYGGSVVIESKPDMFTKFSITLPIDKQ